MIAKKCMWGLKIQNSETKEQLQASFLKLYYPHVGSDLSKNMLFQQIVQKSILFHNEYLKENVFLVKR